MAETKQITPERISRALDSVVGAILKLKERGHELLPLYERLEKELAAARRTEQTLERFRQRASKTLTGKKMKNSDFAPGSFGAHEALHTASIVMDLVEERLLRHPTISDRPEWAELAETAHRALFDLYQAIGAEHLYDRRVARTMALKNLAEMSDEEDAAITADAEADSDNPPADELIARRGRAYD